MKNIIITSFLVICITTLFSCVPAKQLETVKADYARCTTDRNGLKKDNESLTTDNNELKNNIAKLQRNNDILVADTALKSKINKLLTSQYDKINDLYEELLDNQSRLRADADADAKNALEKMQSIQEDLQKKENELRELEKQLNAEKAIIAEMKALNDAKEQELAKKSARVKELEDKLSAQQEATQKLKKEISDALTGFEGNGLTVYEKNGNIYVSLEEQLLFKSGKWDVDAKGIEALKKLGKAIEKNPDINIMVEGHTDDLAYGGSGNIQDNWDLSVKRATAIVKILLANSSINPANLIPSGRSCYVPLDDAKTSAARASNRRTEIIITPRLDLIYEIINK